MGFHNPTRQRGIFANTAETQERNPSLTRFDVALFKTGEDQRGENKANYHNPTRQRGIYGNVGKTRNRNPSLTQRVGMAANAQLQNLRVGLGLAQTQLQNCRFGL